MTLSVSRFQRINPQPDEFFAETEMLFDSEKGYFAGEIKNIEPLGEQPVKCAATCTEQRMLAVVVLQGNANVISIAASLDTSAHAMIEIPAGYMLDIHVFRNRSVDKK